MSTSNLDRCFFYGTLMAPAVFGRVTTGQMTPDPSNTLHNAVLQDYQRHRIRGRDYPAIRPRRGHSVLGVLAYNITPDQLRKLDMFEGDEYEKHVVEILDTATQKYVKAWAYVWEERLEGQLLQENWDFDDFQRTKMHSWISEEMQQIDNDPRGARFWDPNQLKNSN